LIKLYHCPDARSFRCLWLLEELQLPYELAMLQFPPRLKSPEFLQVSPCGTVPWMIDGEAVLFESAAALEYLSSSYGAGELAVPSDKSDRAAWMNWLHFGEASMTMPLATMMRYTYFEPPERRQPQVVADCRDIYLSRLAMVESALQGRDYLVGNRFSAADISVGYALLLSRMLKLQDDYSDTIKAYWERLRQRPAYKAAKHAQSAQDSAVS